MKKLLFTNLSLLLSLFALAQSSPEFGENKTTQL
jgi:hypothetical protein